jgi:hypothetical protein
MTRKSEILFAMLFFLSGAGIVSLLLLWRALLSAQTVMLLASLACPVLFLVASVVIFYRPRIAYGLALAAALLALAWLVWTELVQSRWASSWILLNASGRYDVPVIPIALVKILTTCFVLLGGLCAILRLLPAGWVLRGHPVGERTWPAIALTAVTMAAWFVWAVPPYRQPIIVDGVPATLRILRVEKRGLWFHEISVRTWRDGKFWISRDDRRLFQYQFQENIAQGDMPPAVEQDVKALVQSLAAQQPPSTQPPNALRSWNAEGWYATVGYQGIFAFTTEHATTPPVELVRTFRELDGLKPDSTVQGETRDVCLGFCYDPAAGLGFTAVNQRCGYSPSGYKCR